MTFRVGAILSENKDGRDNPCTGLDTMSRLEGQGRFFDEVPREAGQG